MNDAILGPPTAISAFRPYLPAQEFEISRAFYVALGFREAPLGDNLVEMHFGTHSFLLQDFWVREWAENSMMHLLVEDLDAMWAAIAAAGLPDRFGVQPPLPPRLEPWGLRVAYLYDPAGVLWHLAERRRG